MKKLLATFAALTLAACAEPAATVAPPATPVAPAPAPTAAPAPAGPGREAPPAPLASKPSPFPHIERNALPNGVSLATVEAHALPVVEVRLVVRAGMGFGAPAVAEVATEMLKQGGTRARTGAALLEKIESLGASLGIGAGPDATTLSLGVTPDQLDEALSLLAEVVRTPRFDAGELAKVKARLADEAQDAARSSGEWGVQRVLFSTLYPGSPYAGRVFLASEIAKVDDAKIRDFHRRFYVPSAATVVVAGDVTKDRARAAVEKAFGDWKGAPAPKVEFPAVAAAAATRVVIAHRPKSVQSDVVVTQLIPDRHASDWPAVRASVQVVGGGVTGRLFNDVREKRSLAYRADARILELAHGEQPLYAYAGTQAAKTADAVQGVLDDLASMNTARPDDAEVARASRYLSDVFAVQMETLGTIADLVAKLRTLDLPDDYWDTYRGAVRALGTADVNAASARMFHTDRALIIVAGDADVIAEPLRRFGDVTVVDPEHDFQVMRTLPKDAKK